MSDRITVTGIVLMAAPIGEFDKRLVLLTKERGKITAFAKAARRPNSSLLAAANPFVFGEFSLFEGRSSYRLVQADIKNYFREIAQDMEAACYGSYFLEFSDYYARENSDEFMLLKLLYAALRALLKPKLDNRLVRYVFELKAMMLNGEYPQVFSCAECGKEEEICGYLSAKNGVLCRKCASHSGGIMPLGQSTVYTLQYVIATPVEKLFTFAVSEEVLREFAHLMEGFRRKYIDREFKALEILSDWKLLVENVKY